MEEEKLETVEIDEEVEVEGGDITEEEKENLPVEPQTQMEEENYEVGDTNIQEE